MTRTGCTCSGQSATLCPRCQALAARAATPGPGETRAWARHVEAPRAPTRQREAAGEDEKAFMWKIIRLAESHGWTYFHNHDARRSPAGYPDLTLVRDCALWIETKTNRGKLSMAQQRWLSRLRHAGHEAYCWRPADWPTIVARLTQKGTMHPCPTRT